MNAWRRCVKYQVLLILVRRAGFNPWGKVSERFLPFKGMPLTRMMQLRELHCSPLNMRKKRKIQMKDFHGDDEGAASGGGAAAAAVDPAKDYSCDFIVQHGMKEMRDLENTFVEELTRSLSLKVDLRTYEDFVVKMEDGRQYKLNSLGRIKLVTPLLVSVDFTDNPSAIKPARLALEQSKLNVTPRQEGAVLYIAIPRITRERRENLANVASKKLLNEYKKALNEVYSKYDRELEDHEEIQKIMQGLLKEKKALEKKAIMMIEERRTKLLTEVV